MSKANSPIKVLRTALKRIQRGWTKGTVYEGPGKGRGKKTAIPQVCLRGGIYGYQGQIMTSHGKIAEMAVLAAINELYPKSPIWDNVMAFNDDQDTTFEMVEKVVKLGMIKLETGWEPEL